MSPSLDCVSRSEFANFSGPVSLSGKGGGSHASRGCRQARRSQWTWASYTKVAACPTATVPG